MSRKIETYETTLRDGAQTPGVSFTVGSKLKIAERLDQMGFDFIEGGWPGTNETDTIFFRRATDELELKHAHLAAFGMTGKIGIKAEEDSQLQALLQSDAGLLAIFGKSWMLHVKKVLGTTATENLDTIYNTVRFLREAGRRVFYDAEHFYDGFNPLKEGGDPEYVLETLEAAQKGGAEIIILCDTNGGSTPDFVYRATRAARQRLGKNFPLGIHTHNDGGLALANTLAAIRAGARQVQGTINGMGERTGNLNFCEFLPTAQSKYNYKTGVKLSGLTDLSRFVALESGFMVPQNAPYVGDGAFTHKGGVHIDAMRKHPEAYQHIDPTLVGAQTVFESSDQGGGANVLEMAKRYGITLSRNDPEFRLLVGKMKEMKVLGDAQEFLLLHRHLFGRPEPFDVLPETEVRIPRDSPSYAIVYVQINGEVYSEPAGSSEGALHAFDLAIKKVLREGYPQVEEVKLMDYWARVSSSEGTGSEVVVHIEFGANGDRWTSKAMGKNEQIANQDALIDGYKYHLLRNANSPLAFLKVV